MTTISERRSAEADRLVEQTGMRPAEIACLMLLDRVEALEGRIETMHAIIANQGALIRRMGRHGRK